MNRVAKRGKENPFVRFITFNNNVLSKMCWEPQPRHLNVKGPVISIILNMAKKCPSARTILIWPPRGRVAIVNNNYLCIAHTESACRSTLQSYPKHQGTRLRHGMECLAAT